MIIIIFELFSKLIDFYRERFYIFLNWKNQCNNKYFLRITKISLNFFLKKTDIYVIYFKKNQKSFIVKIFIYIFEFNCNNVAFLTVKVKLTLTEPKQ